MKKSSPTILSFPAHKRRASRMRHLLFAVGIICTYYYLQWSSHWVEIHSSYTQMDALLFPPLQYVTPHLQQTLVPPQARAAVETESEPDSARSTIQFEKSITKPKGRAHPIDILIENAEKRFQALLKKETHDLKSTAAEYRRRRGRHPPPGFDAWYQFAHQKGAVMVEDFFDQIYHDLSPFWGLPSSIMRQEAWQHDMNINIRNLSAQTGSDWFWTQIWLNLTQTIEHLLPDLDIPLNSMDEPRVAVPWEVINEYMEAERVTRKMPPPRDVISEFRLLDARPNQESKLPPKVWEETGSYWQIASRGCHPDSLARKTSLINNDDMVPPLISLTHTQAHTYEGYVSNFSHSTDICHQPDLQTLHGMMIEPLSFSATKTLFPLFAGSKLATTNEILLPAPIYWSNEERFSGGNYHGGPWANKLDKAIWRGVATGGRNNLTNWRGFQRHRFVAMTNATQVSGIENWKTTPQNWAMPHPQYDLLAQHENRLGEWTGEWADTGFIDLMCSPPEPNGTCSYTSPYYSVRRGMKMGDQFDHKYLPDIDGNSFSGRYRGFLMSSSLPIKATIFREWHDSRLIAWKHFVPMDNRFMDFASIMEYFLGYKGKTIRIERHDEQAERIAMSGQEWANKVLRKGDMQIYVLRLLLEYARLSDDRRDNMGWVEDIL